MATRDIKIVIPGALHTDIVALGVERLLGQGEFTRSGQLHINAGGKSPNIARMIAELTSGSEVAVVAKTVKDKLGLWQYPVSALKHLGVNTDFVTVVSAKNELDFPGVALIPVDEQGNNQIYAVPGASEQFLPADIKGAEPLFKSAAANYGILAQTLEAPFTTVLAALEMAERHGLEVVLDPGGLNPSQDTKELFKKRIFLLKPNEHEAELLTGIKIKDLKSAQKAAALLQSRNVENVLITHGRMGAYLFTASGASHIPIPKVKATGKIRDEAGCGDQTMATLCALLAQTKPLVEAARQAVISGTLQFYKAGIQPVTKAELRRNT